MERADLPKAMADEALEGIRGEAEKALNLVEKQLPKNFPASLHESVRDALRQRLTKI